MLKKISNKAFTLIELLASIAILGIILVLVTISYTKIRKNTLNKQYDNLKVLIEQAAIKYSSKSGSFSFFVQELIDENYIEPDDEDNIYDPRDDKPLNCHLISISEDKDILKASLQDEAFEKNGKCDVEKAGTYSSLLALNAKLSGTNIVYTPTTTSNGSGVYPNIINGWTKYDLDITADTSRIEEDLNGSHIIWNNIPENITYYPVVSTTTHEQVIYDMYYYADLYLANGNRYQARMKYKMDNEKPVIYHEKTTITKSTSNDNWTKSKVIVMYVTDKDGVGLDRIYVGPRPCSDLLVDGTIGQAAIPGLVQTYTYTGEVGEAGVNANVCAVDKLGNLADGGNVFVSKIDSIPPKIVTDVYLYDSAKGTDITQYTASLLNTTNQDVNIINVHPDSEGWTNKGHVYKFAVTDLGSGLPASSLAMWGINPSGDYQDRNILVSFTPLNSEANSNNDVRIYKNSLITKGKRMARFTVCDKLNNCRNVNIKNDRIDLDPPTTPEMNFIFNGGSVYTNNSWTNKPLLVAKSSTAASPVSTDLGSGIRKYQILDPSVSTNQYVDYSYNSSLDLYMLNANLDYTRKFIALDKAGNQSGVKTLNARLDFVKPTIYAYIGAILDGFTDPNFSSGTNNLKVYNNSKNDYPTSVEHTRLSGGTPEGSYYLRIKTSGVASPGHGGFHFGHGSEANKVYVTRIVAKIPVGYNIVWASNSVGTGYTHTWLTDTAGTGDWEEYVHVLNCGPSGSFSSTDYFYLSGGSTATTSSPVIWDVAYAGVFDTTKWSTKQYLISAAKDERSAIDNYTFSQSTTEPGYGAGFTAKKKYRGRVNDITSNGTYYVWYKDVAGNSDKVSTATSYIDTAKPTCTSGGDSTTWTTANRTITYGCSDTGGSGCDPNNSGGSKVFDSTTKTYTIPAYTIKDAAGNTVSCPARTANVYVDKSDPTCTNGGDSTTWTTANRTITYGCSDTGSECDPNYKGGSKTFDTTTKTSTIGAYTIKDVAGHTVSCPARTANVYVDKSNPTIKVTAYSYDDNAANKVGSSTYLTEQSYSSNTTIEINSGNWVRGVTFKFNITDTGSGVKTTTWRWDTEYKANAYATTTNGGAEGDIPLSALPTFYENMTGSGQRLAIIKAEDNAGHTTTVTIKVKVDTDPPTAPSMYFVYPDWSPYEGTTTASNVYANTSAKNGPYGSADSHSGVSGYQISQNNSTWTNYSYSSSNSLYAMTSTGTHYRYFRAYDKAGNYGPVTTVSASIDKNLPSCSFSTYSGTLSGSGWYTTSAQIQINGNNATKLEMRCPDCISADDNEFAVRSNNLWQLTVDTKPTGRGLQGRATSSSGKVAYCSTTLYKDTAAPKVTVTANGKTYTGNITVTSGTSVTFNCSDTVVTNSAGTQFYSGFKQGTLRKDSTSGSVVGSGSSVTTTVSSTATYYYYCEDNAGHWVQPGIKITIGSSQSSGGYNTGGSGSCVCSGTNFKSTLKYNGTCPSGQTRYDISRLCANIKLGCKRGSYSRTISNLKYTDLNTFKKTSGVIPVDQPPSATNALSTYSYKNCTSVTSCTNDYSHLYQYFQKYDYSTYSYSIIKYQCDEYINGAEYFDRYHDTEYPYACCTS